MSTTVESLAQTGENSRDAQIRYGKIVEDYLSATAELFAGEFQGLLQQNLIPQVAVDVKTQDGVKRLNHPLLKIPGRLGPGETVVLTERGELYAVQRSLKQGGDALDAEQARPLRPTEVMEFSPSVVTQLQKLNQKSRKTLNGRF